MFNTPFSCYNNNMRSKKKCKFAIGGGHSLKMIFPSINTYPLHLRETTSPGYATLAPTGAVIEIFFHPGAKQETCRIQMELLPHIEYNQSDFNTDRMYMSRPLDDTRGCYLMVFIVSINYFVLLFCRYIYYNTYKYAYTTIM